MNNNPMLDDFTHNPDYIPSEEEQAALLVSMNNDASLSYLLHTDWMSIREAETGTAMPADVKAKRAEARTAIV